MKTDSKYFLPFPKTQERWNDFTNKVKTEWEAFFDGTAPIAGARAPGRLDVMGGVADYSGSLVLELPIAEAAYAAWQWRDDREIRVWSVGLDSKEFDAQVSLSLDALIDASGRLRPVESLRSLLTSNPRTRWAAYIVGSYYIMLSAYSKVSQGTVDDRFGELGANILISSEVPAGAGVASSAAIEVATMMALSEAAGIHPSDLTLAAWCQKVENKIVGAPCGIMDQVTSALGVEDCLLALRCQPHILLGNVPIPPGWRLVGIDSSVKHSVGGSAYNRARVGAFMGLKVIQLESGGKLLENYLAKMTPAEFAEYRNSIPVTLLGSEYTKTYGQLPDRVTRVAPKETYYPQACAEHPILENYRVQKFFNLLQIASFRALERVELSPTPIGSRLPADERELLVEAGTLMYDSHASYTDRLHLGSPETDLLVNLIRDKGTKLGLYGAKITGGGAGGTVAVLCEANYEPAETALEEVCQKYQEQTGITPRGFYGSSPGALQFGTHWLPRG